MVASGGGDDDVKHKIFIKRNPYLPVVGRVLPGVNFVMGDTLIGVLPSGPFPGVLIGVLNILSIFKIGNAVKQVLNFKPCGYP